MANTAKDASAATIFIHNPFGDTGVDDANAYSFGSAIVFSRNNAKQVPTLDTSTPASNRPLPSVLLAGDGLGGAAFGSGAFSALTLRTVIATDQPAIATNITQTAGATLSAANPLFTSLSNGSVTAWGTAGTPATPVLTVQGIASGTAQPVLSQYTRNSVTTTALLDTTTAANNRPFPMLSLSADGAAPLATGTGADGATVRRITLSTRHEAVATPLYVRLSTGSAATAFASGADGATVPRVTVSTRHEAAATPLSFRLSNGTAFVDGTAGTSNAAVFSVQGIANGTPLPSVGLTVKPSATKTRPANTVTYTVGTAYADATSGATVWTLTGCARLSGGSGTVTAVYLISNQNPTLKLVADVFFFNVAPTAINDNATFNTALGTSCQFAVRVSDNATSSVATIYQATGLNLKFVTSGSTSLFAIVEVQNAYVPASGETLTLVVDIDQN